MHIGQIDTLLIMILLSIITILAIKNVHFINIILTITNIILAITLFVVATN